MEIINFRKIDKGAVKAAFTILIPEWGQIQVDAVYVEKEDGAFWVNYASQQYVDSFGAKKSFNMVRWPVETIKKLNAAIRDKIKAGNVKHKEENEKKPIYNEQDIPF
jgi:hypothetical protein